MELDLATHQTCMDEEYLGKFIIKMKIDHQVSKTMTGFCY